MGVLSHVYNVYGLEPLTRVNCNISASFVKFTALGESKVHWLRMILFMVATESSARTPNQAGNHRPRTQNPGALLAMDEYYNDDLYRAERNLMVPNSRVCSSCGTVRRCSLACNSVFVIMLLSSIITSTRKKETYEFYLNPILY